MKENSMYSEIIKPSLILPPMIASAVVSGIFGVLTFKRSFWGKPKDMDRAVSSAMLIMMAALIARVAAPIYLLLYKIYETIEEIQSVLKEKST